MKNLLTVLKKLGKKMTNQDITGTNLVTVVDDIAEKYTGGGGGESGSGGPLVVEATPTMTTDGVTEALDKTWQEIHDAVLTKGVTIIRHDVGGDSEFIRLMILSNVDYDADSGEHSVSVGDLMYTTSTADGYPMVSVVNGQN